MKKLLNVLLGALMAVTVALLFYAVFTGGSNAAISLNLLWGYFLLIFAVCTVLLCAVFGMIKSPSGFKSAALSIGLIIVVIGISLFIAKSHNYQIVDFANSGFFTQQENEIADTGIIVTYFAMAGAFLAAIYSEVAKLFK